MVTFVPSEYIVLYTLQTIVCVRCQSVEIAVTLFVCIKNKHASVCIFLLCGTFRNYS